MAYVSERFPGESEEYRRARDELLNAEIELRRHQQEVAALRRALPLGGRPTEDYAFQEWDERTGRPREVHLSELFEDGKDTLFIYNFMYKPGPQGPLEVPCPVCTSIIDAVDGAVPHLEQKVNFAVIAKGSIEQFRAHAGARGWRNARLLSSAGTSYAKDYGSEGDAEEQFAMATVFTRRDGEIRHHWSSEIFYAPPEPGQHPRHVDFMWPMWAIFERTPEGRPSWMPDLAYD